MRGDKWVTVESLCWPLCVLYYLPPLTRATRTDHSVAAFPHIVGCSGSGSSVAFSSRREGGVPIKGVNDRLNDFKEDALLSANRHNSHSENVKLKVVYNNSYLRDWMDGCFD